MATNATANGALPLATVSDGSPAWMGYQTTSGSPILVSPSASVPLLAGRIEAALPLSATVAGGKAPPAETLSRPCRKPGCEGAKVTRSSQEAPDARAAGHWLSSVKSPVMLALIETGVGPLLVICTPCADAESSVTVTGSRS